MRTLLLIVALLGLAGQPPQREVIRRSVTYVSTGVNVRDERGRFVPNLRQGDFEVYEDGVRQDIVKFVLTHGGRVLSDIPPPAAAQQDGVLLPPTRPSNDSSGRVILIFLDDQHIEFHQTAAVRDLLKKVSVEVVHEGDLFGIVSTGPSSVAVDMTYDRKRLDEAISKISGNGLAPSEIIGTQIHNRRKAFIYISGGYDFDPFAKSRAKASRDRYSSMTGASGDSGQVPDTNPFSKTGNQFAAADLAAELSELTREANRANTVIYTFDPRGLVAGPALDQTTLDPSDWQDHVRETQSSLRVIAELTGGIAGVNTNNFTGLLKRIDAETSDYYVLGYNSSNPDPLKKRRAIEIRVKQRPKLQLTYKTSYTLKPER